MSQHPVQDEEIILDLLESATGQPLQTWRFHVQERIVIGRAPDGDVVIANPYVSRSHAYLELDSGIWRVVAISAQQVVVDGRKVNSAQLYEGAVFRLGANGCSLRFRRESCCSNSHEAHQTLSLDPETHPMLHLDQDQLARDVSAITDGAFFQNLNGSLERLRQFRRNRQDSG